MAVGVPAIPALLPTEQPAPPSAQVPVEKPAPGVAVPIIEDNSVTGSQSSACYVTPKPGTTLFFVEVQAAIEEYRNSSALLFLAVNINSASKEMLSNDSEEMRLETQRLASLGYEIGWYEAWIYQGEEENVPYTFLYILLPVDETGHFDASPEYGYSFYFPNNGTAAPFYTPARERS